MTNDEAIEIIECGEISNRWGKDGEEVEKMAIEALEQVSCLTDRPCPFCRFKTENGCSRWECVFKGV